MLRIIANKIAPRGTIRSTPTSAIKHPIEALQQYNEQLHLTIFAVLSVAETTP